jgi:hypothetical protein
LGGGSIGQRPEMPRFLIYCGLEGLSHQVFSSPCDYMGARLTYSQHVEFAVKLLLWIKQ